LQGNKPNSPRNLPDGENIDEECKFLVPPNTVMDPRLFFIKNDESGYEFLNLNQMDYFFIFKNFDTNSVYENKKIKIGTEKVDLISILSPIEERKEWNLISKVVEIPQNVSAAVQTIMIPSEPEKQLFLTTRILDFDGFTDNDIDRFNDSLERYQAHKDMQESEGKRLEVIEEKLDFRCQEKLLEEQQFFQRILKMRNL